MSDPLSTNLQYHTQADRQTDGQMVVVTDGRTNRQRSNETEDRSRDRKREGLQRETNRGRDF